MNRSRRLRRRAPLAFALVVALAGPAFAAVEEITVLRFGGVITATSDILDVGGGIQIGWASAEWAPDDGSVADALDLGELAAPSVLPGTNPGLFLTEAEVVSLLRPRWAESWTFGIRGEPDHRSRVDELADELVPGVHYDEPLDSFSSSDFRKFSRRLGARAFRALVEDDAADRAIAIEALNAQVADPNVDWSRWPMGKRDLPSGTGRSQFANSHAMAALANAYSMVRQDMGALDRQAVEGWFRDWAEVVLVERRDRMANLVVNWDAAQDPSTYEWIGDFNTPISAFGLSDQAYAGSPVLRNAHYQYNNRWSSMMRTMTMIGVVIDDAEFKLRGAQFFREALAFGWFPEGFNVDFHRGVKDGSIAYPALILGNMVTIADVLLRDGHSNLYDYRTSAGVAGSAGSFPGAIGKRLDGAILELGKYWHGTYQRPAASAPDVMMGSYVRGDQLRHLAANVYYRNPAIDRAAGLRCVGTSCPRIGSVVLSDAWLQDKEAGPSLFLYAVDRNDGDLWPYPDR